RENVPPLTTMSLDVENSIFISDSPVPGGDNSQIGFGQFSIFPYRPICPGNVWSGCSTSIDAANMKSLNNKFVGVGSILDYFYYGDNGWYRINGTGQTVITGDQTWTNAIAPFASATMQVISDGPGATTGKLSFAGSTNLQSIFGVGDMLCVQTGMNSANTCGW